MAQPTYTHTTLLSARSILMERLGDPANIYWAVAEINAIIVEALRTWNAYTSWYRTKTTITIEPTTLYYDLVSMFPTALFGYNQTALSLASAVLYSLLERPLLNPSPGVYSWDGTDQFDLAQLEASIRQRLNRWLGESGAVISSRSGDSSLSPTAGRVSLPDSVIDVRRVAWQDSLSKLRTVLWREDERAFNAYLSGWRQPSWPLAYSPSITPPLLIQIAPLPANPGQLDLLLVESASLSTLASGGSLLPMPDDFAWGLKFGAMADLLAQDGQGSDAQRMAYCEQRYQESVALASTFPSVLQADNGQVWAGSITELDTYQSGWMNANPSDPYFIGFGGRNILAIPPVPWERKLTLDLVRNMTVPALDSDYLQVPRDVLDVIIDYSQHLAMFKEGGEEFMETMDLYKRFLSVATSYNGRLRQMAQFNDLLRAPGLVESVETPRLDIPAISAVGGG